MEQVKKRAPKTSRRQYMLFLEELARNEVFRCKRVSQDNLNIIEDTWKNLTLSLNRVGGPQRDTHAWKRIFCDWKSAVKKRARLVRASTTELHDKPLTDLELKLLEILGNTVVHDVNNIYPIHSVTVDDPLAIYGNTTLVGMPTEALYNRVVCDHHFNDTDFLNASKVHLTKTAIPKPHYEVKTVIKIEPSSEEEPPATQTQQYPGPSRTTSPVSSTSIAAVTGTIVTPETENWLQDISCIQNQPNRQLKEQTGEMKQELMRTLYTYEDLVKKEDLSSLDMEFCEEQTTRADDSEVETPTKKRSHSGASTSSTIEHPFESTAIPLSNGMQAIMEQNAESERTKLNVLNEINESLKKLVELEEKKFKLKLFKFRLRHPEAKYDE
ncbi:uncharacterized protein LOC116160084 [Photinus pyralis]|nr:uncharacterized protein LOC116160084 [Photinus pyralis]